MDTIKMAINQDQLVRLPITSLREFQGNLKDLSDENYAKAKKSILDLGFSFAIHAWENDGKYYILDGHQRLRTMLKMVEEGYAVPPMPTVLVEADNFKQAKKKVLAGTSQYGQITGQGLYEFISESGLDWRDVVRDNRFPEIEPTRFVDEFYGEPNTGGDYGGGGAGGSLAAKYVAPPFSVLDTRQGYWQARKAHWLQKTGNLSETKEGVLGDENMLSTINEGSSNFDPVLAEICYKWFCIDGGRILDPFGGEQTKGVVAGEMGFCYTGVEIRADQVAVNREACKQYGTRVEYFVGDSNKAQKLLPNQRYDMIFTSPPYYDLEIYSKADMSALGTYFEFMQQYRGVFGQCLELLETDSFVVVKVGEIRDKKTGAYRNFVGDNISMFLDLGLKYYNELTVISPAGTAQLRAARSMQSRKIVKLHQNVLVFYKGNLKNIQTKFPEIKLTGEELGVAD